jgi:hypothetical protein
VRVGYTTLFAESSMRLTASADEMSGLGAPNFTATPTRVLARGVAEETTTWPDFNTSS